VPEVIAAAFDAAADCDLLLAVGSTLSVYPAAGVVPAAKQAGALVVILNAEPTGMDPIADAVVRATIGASLPLLVQAGRASGQIVQ
jgi:NAD-dependent deacetylase